MKYFTTFTVLPMLLLVLSGCSDNTSNASENQFSNDEESTSYTDNNLDSNQVRVLTLPTPIQLASIFKAYDFNYDTKILTPVNNDKIYTSNFSRAVCGGIYSVDLGYSTLFEDQVNSMGYYNHLNSILLDIGIKTNAANDLKTRFQQNRNKPDSLSKIILETYNRTHNFLIENEQEDIGYYILAGSYLEGLNLFCGVYDEQLTHRKGHLYNNLFCQHKIFLDNLIELSEYANQGDSGELQQILTDLRNVFGQYNIQVNGKNFEVDSLPSSAELRIIQQKIKTYKNQLMS